MPPSISRLELAEVLPLGGESASSEMSEGRDLVQVGDGSVYGELAASHPLSSEWSPIELYGDAADSWLWDPGDSGREDSRSTTKTLRTKRARPPLYKRPRNPGNFFLTAAVAPSDPETENATTTPPARLEPLSEPAASVLPPGPAANPTEPEPPTTAASIPPTATVPSATTESPAAVSTAAATTPTPVTSGAIAGDPSATNEPSAQREILLPIGLTINHPRFCRAVRGRGDLDAIEPARFASGARVLVYCEVNDPSRQNASAGTTAASLRLAGSLIVKNGESAVVHERCFAAGAETTLPAEGAAYVVLPASIPPLPPGAYRLYIGLEDETSQQFAMSAAPLEFEITAATTPTPNATR